MGIVPIEKLGIISDDWAVEMVIALFFVEVVTFRGIENERQRLLFEFGQMPVHEFGGVANRIRGDRALAFVEKLTGAPRRTNDVIAKRSKETLPERILLNDRKGHRKTDFTPRMVPFGERLIELPVFIGIKIERLFRFADPSSFIAFISRDEVP